MACDNAMLHGHASFLNVKHVLNGESVDLQSTEGTETERLAESASPQRDSVGIICHSSSSLYGISRSSIVQQQQQQPVAWLGHGPGSAR